MSLPVLNLDDKTFEELFEEARSLIPRYAPEWTDHNFSDPGITFIDLLAWITEMQIYSLNRVTDKTTLKFLSLVGIEPRPPIPAHVEVTFSPASQYFSPPGPLEILVSRGTQVAAEDNLTDDQIVFETDNDLWITDLQIKKVITETGSIRVENTAPSNEKGVFYFAFGEDPGEMDKLYLGFKAGKMLPNNEISLTILLYESDLPKSGEVYEGVEFKAPVQLEWQFWDGSEWREINVIDLTCALTMNGQIAFSWPANAKPRTFFDSNEWLYWLRAVVRKPGYEIPPRIDTILLNTVSATHSKTIKGEKHESRALPFYEIQLQHRPVIKDSLILEVCEENEEKHRWQRVRDFDASCSEDRHYTIDLQSGIITFGDDVNGRIPPVLQEDPKNIHISKYRTGGGEIGNLPSGTITRVLDPDLKGISVSNRRPAFGGKDAEKLDDAKLRARSNLKERNRTVTSEDFEQLTKSTPGLRISRVKALPNYHPEFSGIEMPGAVTVVVVPFILPGTGKRLPIPGKNFLSSVSNYLDKKRIISTNLHVVGPIFVGIDVKVEIKINPKLGSGKIGSDTEKALKDFLDPVKGGTEKKGWEFGRGVYKSEIFQVLQAIPGVVCVESVSIKAEGCHKRIEENIKIPRIGLVYPDKIQVNLKQDENSRI